MYSGSQHLMNVVLFQFQFSSVPHPLSPQLFFMYVDDKRCPEELWKHLIFELFVECWSSEAECIKALRTQCFRSVGRKSAEEAELKQKVGYFTQVKLIENLAIMTILGKLLFRNEHKPE